MINEIISEIRIYIINFVYIPYGLEWQGRGFELAPCPLPINSKPLYRFLLNKEKGDKMIKLGDLLKVIELDGPNLKVYTKVSPYESRQIHPSLLPNYYTREVTGVCVETLEIDYDDYYEEVAVNVTIEGPLLKEEA